MQQVNGTMSSLHVRQRELLSKFQREGQLSDDEGNELCVSLRGIVVKLAKKFQLSFPPHMYDELVCEGMNSIWSSCRLFKMEFNTAPSTFFYRTVTTSILKLWHKQRVKGGHTVSRLDDESGKKTKRYLPHVSLNRFVEEHGDINELSVEGEHVSEKVENQDVENKIEQLYDLYCATVKERCILDTLIDVHSLKQARGRKVSQTIRNIASKARVEVNEVNDFIGRVQHEFTDDFIKSLSSKTHRHNKRGFRRDFNFDVVDFFKNDGFDVVEMLEMMGAFKGVVNDDNTKNFDVVSHIM